ncbi:hypothetical protein BH09PSE5_BH09PSE5_17080 [soil metagenome]
MPIYAYRCESCGHAQDVLQKISDPLLTVCPVCGKETYKKQVTAAGFQLKGSGWYVTDFRNNASGAPPATGVPPVKSDSDSGPSSGGGSESKSEGKSESKGDAKSSDSSSAAKSDSKPDSKPASKPDTGPAAA